MIKRLLVLCGILILLIGEAFSQQLSIISLRESGESVSPGKTFTLSFRIENSGNESIRLICQPQLPSNWRCLGCDSLLELGPSQRSVRLLTILIPAKTAAGKYTVKFEVFSADSQQYASANQELTIQSRDHVSIVPLDVPGYVTAGDKARLSFLVQNQGNAMKRLSLQVSRGFVDGPHVVMIPADSAINVSVEMPTDPNTAFHQQSALTLKAFQKDSLTGSSDELAYSTVLVHVIPTQEQGTDKYHRFPVDFRLSYMGIEEKNGNIESGMQAELSGQGSLDPDNQHRVEFRFRGPDRFYLASIGNYEEYFVNYNSRDLAVKAGDSYLSLTKLTEFSRYGRGLQVAVEKSKFSAGGFYLRPRFTPDIKEERGAYAAYRTGKASYLKAAVLYKVPGAEFLPATLFSVESSTTFSKLLKLDAEISTGIQGGKRGSGALLNVAGAFKVLSYGVQAIYTEKNFAGFYRNSRFLNTALNAAITQRINLSLSYSHDERNPELDTLFGNAPTYDFLMGGMSFLYGKRNIIALQTGYYESSDRLALNTFHYRDQKARLTINQFLKENSLYLEGEIAQTDNFTDNVTGISWTMYANLNVCLQKSLFMEGFAGTYNTYRYTTERSTQWIFGGGIRWNYKSLFSLNARVQNDFSPEDYYQDRNLLQLMAEYRPGKQHLISASVRRTLVRNSQYREDMAFSISYLYHFGMPLRKVKHLGSVSGRIINMGVDKVKGIVVRLDGHSTVTDENGNFYFAGIKPDNYYLMIDPVTTQVNYIPDRKTPIVVHVEADVESIVEFGLVKAGKIEGRLSFPEGNEAAAGESTNDKKVFFGTIMVEISNGEEIYRKLIDDRGEYAFINIRPGKWKIRLFAGDDVQGYAFMQKEFTITLNQDQVYKQNIPMVKKQRKVIFQEEPVNVKYR